MQANRSGGQVTCGVMVRMKTLLSLLLLCATCQAGELDSRAQAWNTRVKYGTAGEPPNVAKSLTTDILSAIAFRVNDPDSLQIKYWTQPKLEKTSQNSAWRIDVYATQYGVEKRLLIYVNQYRTVAH